MSTLQSIIRWFYHLGHRAARRFQNAATNVSTKPVQNELKRLVKSVSDPVAKKTLHAEMQSFMILFTRYLVEKTFSQELDWERIKAPTADKIIPYDQLPSAVDIGLLNKLGVLKLNGGLGTSIGMSGAALEVRNDTTILGLTVQQIEHLNAIYHVDIPLILMTSFNTHKDTLRIIEGCANQALHIITFNQSRYPRVMKESLLPYPQIGQDDMHAWYPPGHGDLYNSLYRSGVLDQLLAEGKEYLFVSNSENLGAVVDQRILQHMIDTQTEFIIEVTDKTKADVKGGILIDYEGATSLLEAAQVPNERFEDFTSVHKFKTLNTNNLWINLRALKHVMENEGMKLDIIVNSGLTDDGHAVIQLETAAGAAIKHFKRAYAIHVPRSRFLPVTTCSDLLLIGSNLYSVEHGELLVNKERVFEATPIIKLGDNFRTVQEFHEHFKEIPDIVELDHLTVSGNVYFGRNVTLRGTVIVIADEGQRLDIPDGCILENCLLSGSLNITEI